MQRAAAPSSKSLSPGHEDEHFDDGLHPSKRQKIKLDGFESLAVRTTDSKQFIKASDEDGAIQMAAIKRLSGEASETKWELSKSYGYREDERDNGSIAGMQVIPTAYSEIDSEAHLVISGRKFFGKHSKAHEVIILMLQT